MTRRLFRSHCTVALSVFLASVALIMGVLYGYFSRIQQTQLRMQTQLAAQGVERCGMDYFDGLTVRDCRITWIDGSGAVLYDSTADADAMENHLEREEVRRALASGYGESRRYSATLTERMLYAAQQLSDGTVLRLGIAQSTVLTMLLGTGQGLAAVAVIALLLSAVLARRAARRIVEPINALDLDEPLKNEGYDEIAPLLRRLDSQQRQLRDQTQMRREFTANVSHELKTPLHVISGYAELIQNGMVSQEDIRPFAGKIYDGTQQMAKLLEDITSLSRLDEGATDMRFERTDLYTAAASAVEELRPMAEKAGVSLRLAGGAAPMEGIPALLRSIVFNLVENGVKYGRTGGTVQVQVEPGPEQVLLTVRDDGPGIPAEQQGHIFERFYRGEKSHCKDIPGTGLGLSIVKHAALVHHARIGLESEPGKGTVVTVAFPLTNES